MGLYKSRRDVAVIQKKIGERRQHMDIVKRCHFQLAGKAMFNTLVMKLIEYVDSLLKMCSEAAAEV